MIKLIATDMDGTLLGADHEVSAENVKALRFALSRGVEIAIASGRVHYEIAPWMKRLGLPVSIIGTNGATVHDKSGTLIHSASLKKAILLPILEELETRRLYFTVFTEKTVYAHAHGVAWLEEEIRDMDAENLRKIQDLLSWLTPKTFSEKRFPILQSAAEAKAIEEEVYKCFVFSYREDKLRSAREAIANEHLHIASSGRGNFEVMDKNASKGKGLERLAKALDIPLAETMAIGDNQNDLSMLETAGIGVAMGNADEAIKRRCRMVTATNVEHGVARAIYRALGAEEEVGL